MKFPFYEGKGQQRDTSIAPQLPRPRYHELLVPENYLADQGLVDACNTALLLGLPLLLTGEAGTGKTQLAYSLAWELGFSPPLKFETKSTSEAKDLFYIYDALKRFHDIQSGIEHDVKTYVDYQAMGKAIIFSRNKEEISDILPPHFIHPGRSRSIVLVDEVDKAPRDFPNDILNEIEHFYFRIPEIDNRRVEADIDLLPIVIFTSNSEKNLPDAFLRRCVFYNIPFPERDRLSEILIMHLGNNFRGNNTYLEDVISFFYSIRNNPQLQKKPATAELLSWLLAMSINLDSANSSFHDSATVRKTIGILAKTNEDQEIIGEMLVRWVNNHES